MTSSRPKTLAGRISAIAAEAGAIGRDGRNTQQGYDFTSEAAVKRVVNPLLERHGVAVLFLGVEGPIEWEQRATRNGAAQYVARAVIAYRVVNTDTPDDAFDLRLAAEGIDSGDKALPKLYTMAQKNALLNIFDLVRGDDPDAETPPETMHVQPIGQHAAERFLDAATLAGVENLEALKAVSQAIGRPVKTRAQLAAVDRAHLETMADLVRDWKQRSGADQVFGGDGGTTDVADDAGPGDEGLDLTPPASIEKMTVPEIKRALVAAFEGEGVAAEDVPRLVRKVLASAGMKLPDGELRKAELAAALVAVQSGAWDLPTADRIPASPA
jgi:hypothetical protein